MTRRRSDASAQSVRPGATKRNVGQPHHVFANQIAGHEAERRPWAGEEWRAATKNDGVEIEPILIDEAKVGQASRQARSGNGNLSIEAGLQVTHHRLDIILDKCGVGADRLRRARHDPLRLAPPCRREFALLGVPFGMVFVEIAHDLVHAAPVHAARQAPHVLYPVTKQFGTRCEFLVVDITVQGHVHSEDQLRHTAKSPSRVLQNSLSHRFA